MDPCSVMYSGDAVQSRLYSVSPSTPARSFRELAGRKRGASEKSETSTGSEGGMGARHQRPGMIVECTPLMGSPQGGGQTIPPASGGGGCGSSTSYLRFSSRALHAPRACDEKGMAPAARQGAWPHDDPPPQVIIAAGGGHQPRLSLPLLPVISAECGSPTAAAPRSRAA